MDSSTTDRQLGARLTAEWTTATHGTRTSKLRWYIVNSAATTEVLAASAANISFLNGSTPLITQGPSRRISRTWKAPSLECRGRNLCRLEAQCHQHGFGGGLRAARPAGWFGQQVLCGLTGNLLIQAGTITTNIQQVSSTAT